MANAKAAPQHRSLLDLCRDEAVAPRNRRRTWVDALDRELQAEVMEVKQKWHDGEFALTAYRMAQKIIAGLQLRGAKDVPRLTSVSRWLTT